MKIYNIYDVRQDNTAWSKAPGDVATILSRIPDVINIPYKTPEFGGFWGLQLARVKRLLIDIHLLFRLPRNSTAILQLPGMFLSGAMGCFLLAALYIRKIKVIVLVHDIECVRRYGLKCTPDAQLRMIIKLASAIIVHNAKMEDFFVGLGADRSKLVQLEIFDYLIDDFVIHSRKLDLSIAIAGNLSVDKAGYLSELGSIKPIQWQLFGVGYKKDKINDENVNYMGCFSPDELPKHLTQSFGLIWDGDSIDTCTSRFGEYLKINNPHKLSLYLAAGMPVIIWSEAAEASFVSMHGIGLAVDSLSDLPKVLSSLSGDVYNSLCRNASLISNMVTKGHFTINAINQALKICYET